MKAVPVRALLRSDHVPASTPIFMIAHPDHLGPTTAEPRRSRLFLGVALPRSARVGLLEHLRQQAVHLPGKVVPAENWHLTLRFLGDTAPDAALRLRAELRSAALGGSFTVGFGGLGAFPSSRRASVLWLGLGVGEDALRGLAARLEKRVIRAGFVAENRPFRAHLTLSRLRPPMDVTTLLAAAPPHAEHLTVNAVTLFRSRLGHGAPRYETVEQFPLASVGATYPS